MEGHELDTLGLLKIISKLEKQVANNTKYLKCRYIHKENIDGSGVCSKCGWLQKEWLTKNNQTKGEE